jgi:gliding motility-associated-like protein
LKKLFSFILLFISAYGAYASHVRAGEILFCTDDGLTYYFTVTMYTKPSSCGSDACTLELDYGDGVKEEINRTNGNPCPVPASCGNQQPNCDHCGEMVGNAKKNVYTSVHTYSGPGTFVVSFIEQNREDGILNVPNSGNLPFYVENEIIISPFLGINCNPELTFPPIDNGCTGEVYQHNPGAVDPEGDSLVYSLIHCSGEEGEFIIGYEYPNMTSVLQGSLTIDPLYGTVIWDAPSVRGDYNICILIEEYREGRFVGSVVRDMQLTIDYCPTNEPPVVVVESELCVLAGDSVNELVVANDPNGDYTTLSSEGEAYGLNNSPAVFDEISDFVPVQNELEWLTGCDHVRVSPYLFYFKANDNRGSQALSDFENLEISVIAPAPEELVVSPLGGQITLNWEESICTNATCYKIYRKIDSLGYVADTCVTGVPAETGYELIQTMDAWSSTTFVDDDNGFGLDYGKKYCYMIVACFDDGAESYPSEEICAELKRDVPIITRVSVNSTSLTNGDDTITWSVPTEIDTIQWIGPYFYNIYQGDNFVGRTASKSILLEVDTIYVDSFLNTEEVQYSYSIEVVSRVDTIGKSQVANSLYLQSSPTDNQIDLTWTESVPWENEKYVVFKRINATSFIVLDTVAVQNYSDTGLVNEVENCYYVQSIGGYSVSGIINPILNNSQEHCNKATDNVAPCPPFSIITNPDCDGYKVDMFWENPNDKCADDVVGYNIYYGATNDVELQLFDTIRNSEKTFYTMLDSNSIAGCYAVTAIDTFFNESIVDTFFCVDNCPVYELPLVFSPGGDGYNDEFRPFPFRYIEDINITIFNRWGVKVFSTTDRNILWDGFDQLTNKKCVEGVYYYVGYVNEIRLTGLEPRDFKGYVHLIWEE